MLDLETKTIARKFEMKNDKKNEKEEFTSKAGKLIWHYFFPISSPPPKSEDSRNEGMYRIFAGDEELNENMTATYWG